MMLAMEGPLPRSRTLPPCSPRWTITSLRKTRSKNSAQSVRTCYEALFILLTAFWSQKNWWFLQENNWTNEKFSYCCPAVQVGSGVVVVNCFVHSTKLIWFVAWHSFDIQLKNKICFKIVLTQLWLSFWWQNITQTRCLKKVPDRNQKKYSGILLTQKIINGNLSAPILPQQRRVVVSWKSVSSWGYSYPSRVEKESKNKDDFFGHRWRSNYYSNFYYSNLGWSKNPFNSLFLKFVHWFSTKQVKQCKNNGQKKKYSLLLQF